MAPRQARTRPPKSQRAPQGDAALIEACLRGQQFAWDEVVDRYGRLVYSIPRRYGFGEADADDVFQDVFAILFRKLDTIRDRNRLSAWLIRTTHRECYRVGKQSGRYAQLDQTIEDVGSPPQEQTEAWERQQVVRRALRQLGGPCEELLTALFLAGERPNYVQIAEQLGMKVGSIGPTRSRCFEKLEKILADLDPHPGSRSGED